MASCLFFTKYTGEFIAVVGEGITLKIIRVSLKNDDIVTVRYIHECDDNTSFKIMSDCSCEISNII